MAKRARMVVKHLILALSMFQTSSGLILSSIGTPQTVYNILSIIKEVSKVIDKL